MGFLVIACADVDFSRGFVCRLPDTRAMSEVSLSKEERRAAKWRMKRRAVRAAGLRNGGYAAWLEVTDRGPHLQSVLQRQVGRAALDWCVRQHWLEPVRLAEVGQVVYVLGLEGRRLNGYQGAYKPRAGGISDGLARRAVRECYERFGWFQEEPLGPLLVFRHYQGEAPRRFVLASYRGYSVVYLRDVLGRYAGEVFRRGGEVVVYARTLEQARAMKHEHRHRLRVWPFRGLLELVPGELADWLLEVPAEAFRLEEDDPYDPGARVLPAVLW